LIINVLKNHIVQQILVTDLKQWPPSLIVTNLQQEFHKINIKQRQTSHFSKDVTTPTTICYKALWNHCCQFTCTVVITQSQPCWHLSKCHV